MPEQIKALIVLLPFAIGMFALLRPCALTATGSADFERRRNLWLALTLIVFLAHNFWVYSLLAAMAVYSMTQKESNPVAAYFFIMFAVPAIEQPISGFGGINYFFNLHYLRLLSIVILVPAALRLYADRTSLRIGKCLPDKLLIAYVAFNLFLVFTSGTFTNFLRSIFIQSIDVLLLYYVASRSLRRRDEFRDALMSFCVASAIVAALGIFESVRHWMLYAPLTGALGVDWGFARGLERGESLRAQVSTGQPIAYGYVLAIALGFWLFMAPLAKTAAWRVGVALLLAVGLFVSLSRGPWIGAVAIGILFLLAGKRPAANLVKLCVASAAFGAAMFVIPGGEKFINLLPFVGEGDAATVSYRQRLLEVFIPVILDNPLFGASSYLNSPAVEALRQGEGIIDLVNTYIAVGLRSGLVGLGLFTGFFFAVMAGIWRRMRRINDRSGEDYRLGRALLAVLAGVLVIIFTVSSVTVIPYIYWILAGVGAAYCFAPEPARTAETVSSAFVGRPRPFEHRRAMSPSPASTL